MENLDEFRAEVRDWLEANCPESMRMPMRADEVVWGGRNQVFKNEDAKIWLYRMAERGWTCPTWPTDYGGGGLSRAEERVLRQEMELIGARPPLQSFGIWMLGPVLLEYASEEQKREHIPPIVRGDIRWCQGYSEPGSGSDLAGLRTKAEDCGDYYLVNGSKIWTSMADQADWIFCLVRTDTDAPKHKGISFLLFDMQSKGVSVSPIRLISGASPFCETFFNDVRVPKNQLVGRINHGWTIAKKLLQHERQLISEIGSHASLGGSRFSLPDLAKDNLGRTVNDTIDDPIIRNDIIQHSMDNRAFRLSVERAVEEARSGTDSGSLSSMFKYYGSELNKRKYELAVSVVGSKALGWEASENGYSDQEIATTRGWLRSKANSIEGGTSEIQKNVIAKRVLDLPD